MVYQFVDSGSLDFRLFGLLYSLQLSKGAFEHPVTHEKGLGEGPRSFGGFLTRCIESMSHSGNSPNGQFRFFIHLKAIVTKAQRFPFFALKLCTFARQAAERGGHRIPAHHSLGPWGFCPFERRHPSQCRLLVLLSSLKWLTPKAFRFYILPDTATSPE